MDPSRQQRQYQGGGFNAGAPAFLPGQQQQQQQQQQQLRYPQHQGGYYQQNYYQQGYYQEQGGDYGGTEYSQSGYQQGFHNDNPRFAQQSQTTGGYYQQYDPQYNNRQQPPEFYQQQAQRGTSYNEHRQQDHHSAYQHGQQTDWRRDQAPIAPPMKQQEPKAKATSGNKVQHSASEKPNPQSTKQQRTIPSNQASRIKKEEGSKIQVPAVEKAKKVDSATDWETELENVSESSASKPEEVSTTEWSPLKSQNELKMNVPVEGSPTTTAGVSLVEEAGVSGAEDVIEIEELKGKYGKLKEPDQRPHLNVVFIGHVDAGKSTTCGNILYLTDKVDQRTIEKYEREAKEKNRDTWFFAFITDVNEEERQKGKTVEVGRASFELEKTRFTILDAPGHKSFVPNMISGAAQADVAVLIISARKGEFETGFERGGQTREHAMLAKTLGVSQLVVAVNKMDDPTCNWSEDRYRDIEKKLTPFLKGCGYNPTKDITFVPISGLSGQNLKFRATDPSFKLAGEASWYGPSKPTLLEILNNLSPPERNEKDPLRIPLLEGFRDQGVMAVGKVEAGTIVAGQNAVLMPKRLKIQVVGVQINDEDVSRAKPGENVTLRVTGVEEDQIDKGMVLCPINHPCPIVTRFKAQVMTVELLEHRPLITAGYSCVIHAHTACEEVQLVKLLEVVDKTTKKKKYEPQFVKGNSMVVCEMQMASPICMEPFNERPQLGRFTLRDEGKTIAVGKVLEILS